MSIEQQAGHALLPFLDLSIESARISPPEGDAKMNHAATALSVAHKIRASGTPQGVDTRLAALLDNIVVSTLISPASGYAKMSYAAMALRIADEITATEKVPPKVERNLTALFNDMSECAHTSASSGDAMSYEGIARQITARLDLAKLDHTLDYVWLSPAEGGVKISYALTALHLANEIKAAQGPRQAVDARLADLLEDMEKSALIDSYTSRGLMNYAAVAGQIELSLGTTQRKARPLQPGR